jgi:hypothetical protein
VRKSKVKKKHRILFSCGFHIFGNKHNTLSPQSSSPTDPPFSPHPLNAVIAPLPSCCQRLRRLGMSPRRGVGEHTKSLLKSQPASPTCISRITNNLQITNNLPGGNEVTGGESGNEVTWGRNTIKSFSADSKFPVRRTWELTRGKIDNVPYPSHQSPCPK